MGHALGIGQALAGLRLFRQVEAIAFDIGVGGVQQGQVVLVAKADVVHQVVLEARDTTLERLGQADQGHALVGEGAEVHGMAATGAADGDGHVLAARLHDFRVPLAEHAQPPAEVTVAVGTRRTVMSAHGEIDLAAGAHKFVGDLYAGRAGTHHQHGALRQLPGVEVGGGVDLVQGFVLWRDGRDHRALERAGGGDDAGGADRAFAGLDGEARAVGIAGDLLHLELQAGEAVVPDRAVGHQGIPAAGAPGFGDTVAFQHQVRHAELAQVFAHGHPGLAGADHQGIDFKVVQSHVHCPVL